MTVIARSLLGATNYTAVVRPLQWLVIGLIFLFFLRVIRAVFVEVRPAGPGRPAPSGDPSAVTERRQRPVRVNAPERSDKQLFLEVIEPRDQEGKTFELDGEVTVGRSTGLRDPDLLRRLQLDHPRPALPQRRTSCGWRTSARPTAPS